MKTVLWPNNAAAHTFPTYSFLVIGHWVPISGTKQQKRKGNGASVDLCQLDQLFCQPSIVIFSWIYFAFLNVLLVGRGQVGTEAGQVVGDLLVPPAHVQLDRYICR